jgi:hypothetical protein
MSARQESGPLTPLRVAAAFPSTTRGTSRNRPGTAEAEDGRLPECCATHPERVYMADKENGSARSWKHSWQTQ